MYLYITALGNIEIVSIFNTFLSTLLDMEYKKLIPW